MKKILAEIQSGQFAREWLAEHRSGGQNFARMRQADAEPPDRAGRRRAPGHDAVVRGREGAPRRDAPGQVPGAPAVLSAMTRTHALREDLGRRTSSQQLPDGGPALLYVDLHLVHEVTSPQAFEGLRLAGRRVRRPDLTVATVDHNVPTGDRSLPIADPISRRQVDLLLRERPRLRHRALRPRVARAGDRACDRPGAGRSPSRA